VLVLDDPAVRVINAKYQWMLSQFNKWGYEFVDEIVWVKVGRCKLTLG
jgi:hypothetical protein